MQEVAVADSNSKKSAPLLPQASRYAQALDFFLRVNSRPPETALPAACANSLPGYAHIHYLHTGLQ